MPLLSIQNQLEDSITGIEELYISARNFESIGNLPINNLFYYSPFRSNLSKSDYLNSSIAWWKIDVPNFDCNLSIKQIADDNGKYYLHVLKGNIAAPSPELIKQMAILSELGVWTLAKPAGELCYVIAEIECFGALSFEVDYGNALGKGARSLIFTIEQKMLVPAEKLAVA